MTYKITTHLGASAVGSIDTAAAARVGTIARGFDEILGEGEFIYLKGNTGTVTGSTVVYDTYNQTTTPAAAGTRGPVAVATAATVGSTYGWYQISGAAVVKETGATSGANVYVTSTAGVPSVTVVAGDRVDGMKFISANGTPSSGFAYAQLSRPSLNGNG